MDTLKQMLEKAFTTLKLDVKLGIVLWIFTSVTADKGVSFTCHGNQVEGYTCVTMLTQQTCSHGYVIHVNSVHDHKNMECASTGIYLTQDEFCTRSIKRACNQRSTCNNFTSPIQPCHLHRCITAFYTCSPRSEALIPTTTDVNTTVGRTNPGAQVGGPIRTLGTAGRGHRPTSASRPSSTVVGSDGDDDDDDGDKSSGEKSAEKSKDVIIATVGAVVFIIALAAIVLLLMFVCPMDCPFRRYRARMMLHREQQQRLSQQQRQQQRQSQQQQQQQQGRGFGSDDEYDYIDVNSMKSLKSRSAGETNNLTTVHLNTLKHNSGYLPGVSPDHKDYTKFSARESLSGIKTPSLPSRQNSSVMAVPAPSRKYMPSRLEDSKHSDESSCKELNKYGSLPSSAEHHNLPAQKEAKMNTLPVRGKQHLNTGLNNGERLPHLRQLKEDGADRMKDFVIKIGSDGIYDKARPISTSSSSSSSSASAANYEIYHNMTSIEGDYAHLARHGDEIRIIGNIYN